MTFSKRRTSHLGGGLAACMGAAALLQLLLGNRVAPRRASLWGFGEGDGAQPGPDLAGPVDVGSVVSVGAGAVASGLAYWLREVGVEGGWRFVDPDRAEIHNTSRGMGLLAADAGWSGGIPTRDGASKAQVTAALIGANHFEGWYEEWVAEEESVADLILPLANERGVREAIGQRGAPILVHATTSPNWTAELHRHIPERDDCIACRLPDDSAPRFACSTGAISEDDQSAQDVSLPFLSGAAGLMLVAGLLGLQHGVLPAGRFNHWRLLLDLPVHRTWQISRHRCIEGCLRSMDESVRRTVNKGTRWAGLG